MDWLRLQSNSEYLFDPIKIQPIASEWSELGVDQTSIGWTLTGSRTQRSLNAIELTLWSNSIWPLIFWNSFHVQRALLFVTCARRLYNRCKSTEGTNTRPHIQYSYLYIRSCQVNRFLFTDIKHSQVLISLKLERSDFWIRALISLIK